MKDKIIEKFLQDNLLDGSLKVKAGIPGITKSHMILKHVLSLFYDSLYSTDISEISNKCHCDQGMGWTTVEACNECGFISDKAWPESKLKPREVSVGERSVENDLCECGHERKYHGKSKSINYTEGKCNQCDCENFVIDSRSNLTKAEAIIRNYLRIRPRDHIKFLMAMKAVDELYYSSYNKDQT